MSQLNCFSIDRDSIVVSGDFGEHRFPIHSHTEYAVCVVDRGLQTFITARNKGVLSPSCFASINPEQLHSGQNANECGWHQYVLFFNTDSVERFYDENDAGQQQMAFRSPLCEDSAKTRSITNNIRLMAQTENTLERQCLFQDTLAALSALSGANLRALNPSAGFIKRTEELMSDAPEEQHTLESLADIAGMSKFHFLRSFRELTGLTPHAYLTQKRLAKAFSMLKDTDKPVTEIAVECGFSDQPHFIRCFKKLWGTTPGKVTRK